MVTKNLVRISPAKGTGGAVPSGSGAMDDKENCVNEQLPKDGDDDKKCAATNSPAPTKETSDNIQLGSVGASDISQGHSKHDFSDALSMPTDGTIDEGKLAASASAMPPPNNDTMKKRSLAIENEDNNGQKKSRKIRIDLTDVSAKPPILKVGGKSGSSKFQGVTFHKGNNKWVATITIYGKQRHIGTYDNEEEAAADYARAGFKYAPKKLEQKQKQKQKRIDLTDVPAKPLILKVGGKSGTSKYQGVYLDTARNKWKAEITIDGKKRTIGHYNNEDEAAADYARAVFKYKERKTEVVHQQQQSPDLSEKPSVVLKGSNCGTSQLKGTFASSSSCIGDGVGPQGMVGDAVGSMMPEAAMRMHPAFRSGGITSTHTTEGWSVPAIAGVEERHPSSVPFSFDGPSAGVAATATNGDSSSSFSASQEMPQLPESGENSSNTNTSGDTQRLLEQNQFLEDSLMKAQAEIQCLKDLLMKTQAPAGVLGSADGSANQN